MSNLTYLYETFFMDFFFLSTFLQTQDVNLIEATDIVAASLSAGQCWANEPEFEMTCEKLWFYDGIMPSELLLFLK